MRSSPTLPVRRGFTMIEMMISMTIMLIVAGAALNFFRVQGRAIENATGRLDGLQTLRAVQSMIDRELRLAGGITGQPVIVYAGPMAIAFNVDLVTRKPNDHTAVYYNPTADSLGTESWLPSRALALPLVSKTYPAVSYLDDGGNRSTAETIAYFLRRDTSAIRSDVYAMFRRVNDRDSTVVARNLIVPTDSSFFRYWRTNAAGTLSAVATTALPTYWDNAAAVNDSLRVVDLRISTWYRDVRMAKDIIRTMTSSVKLLNAGLLKTETCGAEPLPARNTTATLITDGSGNVTAVRIGWTNSLEETGGEKDVTLYIVQRRPSAGGDWITLSNQPATGVTSYTFDDQPPVSGSWQYNVVAQDCSPSNSTAAISNTVVVP
jgi:prepilin-type N-terminal cleavage/methylation domain-containing protein